MTGHIAIYTPDLSTGGVGKMRTHLIREMVARGLGVDLLVATTESPLFKRIPDAVRVVCVGTTHPLYSLPALYRYFRQARPRVLITDRLRLSIACHRARAMARVGTRLYLSVHNPLSVKLDSMRPHKRRELHAEFMKWAPRNDRIIAVSRGVADDLIDAVGVSAERIRVVHNPVITDELFQLAQAPVEHPFFVSDDLPVILSAGRMTEQKDFQTLVRAFHKVRQQRDCRLLLLGDRGGLYDDVASLVARLGLESDVSMPGFEPNPYRYMARAQVFALSSRWEGFGNVLVEALATGLPVVATDCPVGPREILQNGRLGRLVPIGGEDALAAGLLSTLEDPPDARELKAGVEQYTVQRSLDGYLNVFGEE